MDRSELIERLRIIFADVIEAEEDSEFDDPEFITGETVDFIKYRSADNESFLHCSAIRGYLEAAQLLVALGIDIDLEGDMDNTALHYAARHNHMDIYDYLVSQGASESIVNEFGKTPRQYKEEKLKAI